MFVIGIAGASGSGKTYLANTLHSRLGSTDSAIITVDSYYRAQDDLDLDTRAKQNYDHPDSLELDLLVKHLEDLRAKRSIEVPVYDYAKHTRSGDYIKLLPKKFLIVEGILTFHEPRVRDFVNLGIFVDTPLQTCFDRRMSRDTVERGRTHDSVISQWNNTVVPMYQEFCLPGRSWADLVYCGDETIAGHVDALVQAILKTPLELADPKNDRIKIKSKILAAARR